MLFTTNRQTSCLRFSLLGVCYDRVQVGDKLIMIKGASHPLIVRTDRTSSRIQLISPAIISVGSNLWFWHLERSDLVQFTLF